MIVSACHVFVGVCVYSMALSLPLRSLTASPTAKDIQHGAIPEGSGGFRPSPHLWSEGELDWTLQVTGTMTMCNTSTKHVCT